VILYECCILKHPFDARHQCALIMKIIQSPVPPLPKEIPPELSRLTMWLLTKDPVQRPSIRDVICEERVRDKLVEYRIALPAELRDAPTTYRLSGRDTAGSGTLKKTLRPPVPPSAAEPKVVLGNRVRGGHANARRSPSAKVSGCLCYVCCLCTSHGAVCVL
jgi:serine/threonine protein kinase